MRRAVIAALVGCQLLTLGVAVAAATRGEVPPQLSMCRWSPCEATVVLRAPASLSDARRVQWELASYPGVHVGPIQHGRVPWYMVEGGRPGDVGPVRYRIEVWSQETEPADLELRDVDIAYFFEPM